jgi:hypothetical protein
VKLKQRKKLIKNKITRNSSKIMKVIWKKDKISMLVMFYNKKWQENKNSMKSNQRINKNIKNGMNKKKSKKKI